MGVLIKLADGKAGVNGDATLQSEQDLLQMNLARWAIQYELPTALNGEDATVPVVIRESFTQLPDSVTVIPSANGFVNGLISAYHQGLHLRLRPDDVWLSILSQLRVWKIPAFFLHSSIQVHRIARCSGSSSMHEWIWNYGTCWAIALGYH